jgi:uncharacterized repeat protein (TIGR04076 family)
MASGDFKITVLKRMFNPELAKEYCQTEVTRCDRFTECQEIHCNIERQPENFCSWAWNDIYKVLLALLQGGRFDHIWMKQENMNIICCSDGIRPVVFKIEHLPENA